MRSNKIRVKGHTTSTVIHLKEHQENKRWEGGREGGFKCTGNDVGRPDTNKAKKDSRAGKQHAL